MLANFDSVKVRPWGVPLFALKAGRLGVVLEASAIDAANKGRVGRLKSRYNDVLLNVQLSSPYLIWLGARAASGHPAAPVSRTMNLRFIRSLHWHAP
jgi:hypothetical protein